MFDPKFNWYLKRLKDIYFEAISSFYLYEAFREELAPNIVWAKKAKENGIIINNFKRFFGTLLNASIDYSLIQLSKLFDTTEKSLKQSLTLRFLIEYAEKNREGLGIDYFKKHYQGEEINEWLIKRFKGITPKDILALKKMLPKKYHLIQKFKKVRDKRLSHENIRKSQIPPVLVKEIKKLLETAEIILNILSYNTTYERSQYRRIKEKQKQEMKHILNALKKK